MIRFTRLLIMGFLIIPGILHRAEAQDTKKAKTKIMVDEFRPVSENNKNEVFEESIPHLIRFGFIHQKNDTLINKEDIKIRTYYGKEKKSQNIILSDYKNNNEYFKEHVDFILFGDYSFTEKEIYIMPKLFDTKTAESHTLQPVRISEFEEQYTDIKYLTSSYIEKIKELSKTGMTLRKVGICWAKRPNQEFSSFEESLYRGYVIDITKAADSINLVEILNWDVMEPFY
ncbi:MAG: hypothetical protein K8R68_03650 [Bacteroidales bacterium]|nr:hypothetical protein [Bacteroidales bacterium]